MLEPNDPPKVDELIVAAEPPPEVRRARSRRKRSTAHQPQHDPHVSRRERKALQKKRRKLIIQALMAVGIVVISLYLAIKLGTPSAEIPPPP